MLVQGLPEPFPADVHPLDPVVCEVVGEFTDAPVCEGAPQLGGTGPGRRDDELALVIADQAGTASRPPGVQRGQALRVKRMDHVPDSVLVRGHQPGDRRHGVPDADAMMINAWRTRTDSCSPRRTICCSFCPSSSVNRRALTGSAIYDLTPPTITLPSRVRPTAPGTPRIDRRVTRPGFSAPRWPDRLAVPAFGTVGHEPRADSSRRTTRTGVPTTADGARCACGTASPR